MAEDPIAHIGGEGEPAIRFSHVSYSYDRKTNALDDVSFEVPAGQFVCVLGGNGSGKSTLAKHVNALLVPDSGTVTVHGLDTSDRSLTYTIRQLAGMVFQNPDDQLVASIVESDVAFGPENLGIPSDEIRTRVDEALAAVGLDGYQKHEIATLSGGMRQRVAIAGIIAMGPRIFLLDEAASMLDPTGKTELFALIRGLHAQGFTVLLVTHDYAEARAADRALVLKDGRLIADDVPEAILANEALLKDARLYFSLEKD